MTYPTLATRVTAVYEQHGDRARSLPLTRPLANSKAGKFKSKAMILLQSFVYKACGAGFPGGNVDELYSVFLAWQPNCSCDNDQYETLRGKFRTPHALRQALSDDIDEAVEEEGWMRCPLTELDQTFEAYFRPSFDVVMEALKTAPHVRYWCRDEEDEGPSDCRETPFESDAFRLSEERVINEHGDDAFVVGLHVFSDSCAISGSQAHKLYPIRVKVLNALTVEEQWYTVAYVPQVPTEKGPCGAERSRLRRMAVLQRVLYLTFQSLVNVSHSGVPFAAGELGELRAFPRILLYMCDQPEERAVLCLKSGMCQMPCSSCDVHVADMATETALKARSREPLITVERQLEAHGHRAHGRESQRRAFIEKTYSINSQPPALAAMAGMCTPPFLLHRMIACDVLSWI